MTTHTLEYLAVVFIEVEDGRYLIPLLVDSTGIHHYECCRVSCVLNNRPVVGSRLTVVLHTINIVISRKQIC